MIRLNDRGPLVLAWRTVMSKRFSGYAVTQGALPLDTDVYGPRAAAWQKEYERRTRQLVDGVVSDNDLNALGIVGPPPATGAKPVIFTVEGHLSDMWQGPCAETARILESQGVCRWQPVGYGSTAIPFDNDSGVNELNRLLNDKNLLPVGAPWGMVIFSQGGIIGSRFFMEQVLPDNGQLHWRLKDLKRVLAYGNPYRENNVIADWVPDPPTPGTQGLSDVRMVNTPPYWREVSRHGDLYAENQVSDAGEMKTAIYKMIQGEWSGGQDSIFEQIAEMFARPLQEVYAVFVAIISGISFAANMGPHGMYDLGPGIEWMRGVRA